MTRCRSSAVAVSPVDQEAARAAEAEMALLGGLMLGDAGTWPRVRDLVTAAHFSRADHRLIFTAIEAVIAEHGAADSVLVMLKLGAQLEAAGGRAYVAQLVADTPSAAVIDAHAKIVREYANRGKVADITERIAAKTRLGQSAAESREQVQAELAKLDLGREPLPLEMVSQWDGEPEPGPRDWVVDGLIPAAKVTSLIGTGGGGKTLVALQFGMHVSMGRSIFGLAVKGGPVLGIFCEDDKAELNRRLRAACAAEEMTLADVDQFAAVSREGQESVLCSFERDVIRLSTFYWQLDATIAALGARLVILDTAADLFAGDFISTPQVRQFLKVALGGYCARHGCAVLLLMHPSKAGEATGEGDGFSTAWSNSVRSRLYLSRPQATEDSPADAIADKRVLEVKKSNYTAKGSSIPLTYDRGCFTIDADPVEPTPARSKTRTTRIAMVALEIIRATEPAVTSFRVLFDELQARGEIAEGDYQERRKPLQRALRQLVADGFVRQTETPPGYRLGAQR